MTADSVDHFHRCLVNLFGRCVAKIVELVNTTLSHGVRQCRQHIQTVDLDTSLLAALALRSRVARAPLYRAVPQGEPARRLHSGWWNELQGIQDHVGRRRLGTIGQVSNTSSKINFFSTGTLRVQKGELCSSEPSSNSVTRGRQS